jgi:hypothetical protein
MLGARRECKTDMHKSTECPYVANGPPLCSLKGRHDQKDRTGDEECIEHILCWSYRTRRIIALSSISQHYPQPHA